MVRLAQTQQIRVVLTATIRAGHDVVDVVGRHTVCAWQHNPGGWWLAGSWGRELDGTITVFSADNLCRPLPGEHQCLNTAVWARQFSNHHTSHLIGGDRCSARHKPQTETLRKVVEARDGWPSPMMYYPSDPRVG